MKLLRLQALNFRSFEQLDLDLNVDGLVAVVGDNGAGKSTIFAAVEWGLYGSRGRGALPVRRDGSPDDQDCWVEVHFEVGGRAYGVRRIEGRQASLLDLPTGAEICTGRDETSRRIATLLGLTRDMFRGTFYARQREVQALDSDNEVKRREQVELLLGIERLRRAAAHAQTAVKDQQHLVNTLEAGAPDLQALKAEAERVAREARHGAPIVQEAELRLDATKKAREQAKALLARLRAQEREMMERRAAAQAAEASAQQERAFCTTLRTQLEEAEAATAELAELAPMAERVESLAAREREMDLERAHHERAAELRAGRHRALTVAAGLSDELATLVAAEGAGQSNGAAQDASDHRSPQEQVQAAEEELEALRPALRQLAADRQTAERRAQGLREQVARGQRATELDALLADLPVAEHAVERALAHWHALKARRAQLDDAIRHDTEHREAVLAGERQAACPTCKRAYGEGELEEIVAGYDRDLQAARDQLADLDQQLPELEAAATTARGKADALRRLDADRRALEPAPKADALPALRDALEAADAEVGRLTAHEARTEAQLTARIEQLPRLRARAREAEERGRRLAELQAQRSQAESEARLYAEQLAGVGANGYDPDAHVRVRTEVAAAQAAGQRCAALRAKADGLELLRHLVADQEAKAVAAEAERAIRDAAVAEVAVEAAEVATADAACSGAEREVDSAHAALLEASRRAASESEAVAAANARLKGARERTAELRQQRRELRVRSEVAEALSAYREDASRRARPTLEHETGLLLGQTTRQRYNTVQLTDSYQLEIADGPQIHPLRRFSGGEQDLAGLCLRLALSRTLARQRGAETGFVLLDEVFGSQDLDRRRALLEQLHAFADTEFRQVFVVSHTHDVVEHCDLTIDVDRDDNAVSTAVGPHR
ncbi:MAG: AAA family ATPase [Solirubrobacteraceae bacterium]